MSAAEWIAKRREVERSATSGPWHQGNDTHRYENAREAFTRKDMHDPESYDVWPEAAHPEDAAFVVDARTSLPLALDALDAVLTFATAERDKISRTYIEQPGTAYAGYANAMDDVIRIIEGVLP